MLASDAIAMLAKFIAEHGDLRIVIQSSDYPEWLENKAVNEVSICSLEESYPCVKGGDIKALIIG